MKKSKTAIISVLIIAAIVVFFSGCSADIVGQKIGNKMKARIVPTQEQASTRDMNLPQSENSAQSSDTGVFPITYLRSDAGDGAIRITVNSATIVRNRNDLVLSDGFLEDSASVYGGPLDSPVLYKYPEMFLDDGSMRDNIYMVLLDVSVENPDGATSRYYSGGEWIDHYENPYMFQASALCELVYTKSSTGNGFRLAYFSEKNAKLRNPDEFQLNVGEKKRFELGFLVGYELVVDRDQLNLIPVSPEELMLWSVLPDMTEKTWELQLQ